MALGNTLKTGLTSFFFKKKTGYINIREIRLQSKLYARDNERHYMKIKGSVHQENTAVLNVCTPKNSFKINEAKTGRAKRRNRQI